MTQRDFLDTLRKALNGQVAPHVVTENLEYYENYIYEEVRKGRLEWDVLDELGDPRLLARTIIDAEDSSRENRSRRRASRYEDVYYNREEDEPARGAIHISKWIVYGVLFLIIALVFVVLFFTFKTAFSLMFSLRGLWFWIILLIIIYNLSRRR